MAGLSYYNNNTRTPRAFALYRGPASRDQLCNMVADLETRVAGLEALCANLRDACAKLHEMASPYNCDMCGDYCLTDGSAMVCKLDEHLRDLGVDVVTHFPHVSQCEDEDTNG